MAFLDLHDKRGFRSIGSETRWSWRLDQRAYSVRLIPAERNMLLSLTVLFSALLAAILALQSLPAERPSFRDAAVCEKPIRLFLPFH